MNMAEEFRQDMLQENHRDYMHELRLRRDLEYALEELGATELIESLEQLTKKLNDLGYELTVQELLDHII